MNATTVGWVWCMLAAATAARAGCSRTIEAPMAPVGLSVHFENEQARGVFPTLLQEAGAAAGCLFHIYRVPRARLQKMFESTQADVLAPASFTTSRDDEGEFIPLVQLRASLQTLGDDQPAPRSLAELVARRGYKLAVVRGFTFGPAYDHTLATLRAQHRLVEQPDAAGVARALRQGLAHASIMTAHIFAGALQQEPDLSPLTQRMRVHPLTELRWSDSGIYLSRRLDEADRRVLRTALRQAVKSGRVWQLFNEGYPAGSLTGNLRPLP